MSKEIVVQPQPRAWLEDSVLQPYVSRYGAHLRRGRYAPSTQRIYLCCVAHFAHWLAGEQYGLNAIGEAVVACFLSEHMPACACPYPVRRLGHELRAALARLLEVLRADGVGTLDPALDSVVLQELARFDAHMRDVWGLADTTRRRRGRVVGEFLLAHFGDQPITMSTISAASVRRFVLGEQGRSAGSIGVIGGAIGCYLRFRSMSGDRVIVGHPRKCDCVRMRIQPNSNRTRRCSIFGRRPGAATDCGDQLKRQLRDVRYSIR